MDPSKFDPATLEELRAQENSRMEKVTADRERRYKKKLDDYHIFVKEREQEKCRCNKEQKELKKGRELRLHIQRANVQQRAIKRQYHLKRAAAEGCLATCNRRQINCKAKASRTREGRWRREHQHAAQSQVEQVRGVKLMQRGKGTQTAGLPSGLQLAPVVGIISPWAHLEARWWCALGRGDVQQQARRGITLVAGGSQWDGGGKGAVSQVPFIVFLVHSLQTAPFKLKLGAWLSTLETTGGLISQGLQVRSSDR